jgi:RNA polymerase sigma-70 factor (ECF subfamily)
MRTEPGALPVAETDLNLLARWQAGDETAFDTLFLRHYERVYRVAYGLTGSRADAEDLAQETFLVLFRQPPDLAGQERLVAWLCRVALNRGYNALRGEWRARERAARAFEPPPTADPENEAERAEARARVQAALAALPERQTRLLLLRHAGCSYAEVAAALEIAPGSVGTLLARAERAFQTAYEQLDARPLTDTRGR